MEREIFHHTDKGTPQGGIISPLLANLCLDGLEAAVCRHKTEGRKHMLNVTRYADDFVSTGDSKEWPEDEANLVSSCSSRKEACSFQKKKPA